MQVQIGHDKELDRISREALIDSLNEQNLFYKELNLIDFKLIKKKFDNSFFPKMFFFNAKIIHKILYEHEEVIRLDNLSNKENLSFYYYLVSLIKMDPYTINYIYDLNFVQKVDNIKVAKDITNSNYIGKTIIAKIILDLIDNFRGFSDVNLDKVLSIEKEYESIIRNNISHLEEINTNLTENFIKSANIYEVYTEILISLIKKDKLSDFEYASDIMNRMDMENIEINEYMFKKLEEVLNSNEMMKYSIENNRDLNDSRKINFHYIILKMILKNSIYIYQILFLSKTRHNILLILNDENNKFFFEKNNNNEKMEYVIIKYTDSAYYYAGLEFIINDKKEEEGQKIGNNYQMKNMKNHLINSVNFNKNTTTKAASTINAFNENNLYNKKKGKKEYEEQEKRSNDSFDITDEENYFKNRILENSVFLIHTKEEEKTFVYDEITFGKKNISIKEKFLQEMERQEENQNQNLKILIKYLRNFEEKIKKEFNLNYCLYLKLRLKKEEREGKNQSYDVSCTITFYDPISKEETPFKDHNILEHFENLDCEAYIFLINQINNELYSKEKYIDREIKSQSKRENKELKIIKEANENAREEISMNSISDEQLEGEASGEEIIKYIKNINTDLKLHECVREISNQYFYIYGEKSIVVISELYKKRLLIILDEKIYNISEKKSNKNNQVELVACCPKNINLIDINMDSLQYHIQQYQIPNIVCFFCYQMINDIYVVLSNTSVIAFQNIFNSDPNNSSFKYDDKLYYSGAKISNTEIALTSNSLYKKGEDNLMIINVIERKIVANFGGFSYVYGPNGLAVINVNDDNKIIIAACKKYMSGQKNGILLIEHKPNQNENNHTFYETGNFEVNCTCPIVDRNNGINNFFLVGGFDSDIGEGQIKLFKFKKTNKIEEGYSSIEFLQNIEFEFNSKFQGFEMPITGLHQSSTDGKLLVTSLNNVYLLSKPNLDFYLNE